MSGYMAFSKITGAPFMQYPEGDPRHVREEAATESVEPMDTKQAPVMSNAIVPMPQQYLRETKAPRSMLGRLRDYTRQAGRYLPTVVDIGNSAQKAGYVNNPYLKSALSIGNIIRNAIDPKKKAEIAKQEQQEVQSAREQRTRRSKPHPSSRSPMKTSTALVNFRKPIDLEEVD
jgi:hypothetical protein